MHTGLFLTAQWQDSCLLPLIAIAGLILVPLSVLLSHVLSLRSRMREVLSDQTTAKLFHQMLDELKRLKDEIFSDVSTSRAELRASLGKIEALEKLLKGLGEDNKAAVAALRGSEATLASLGSAVADSVGKIEALGRLLEDFDKERKAVVAELRGLEPKIESLDSKVTTVEKLVGNVEKWAADDGPITKIKKLSEGARAEILERFDNQLSLNVSWLATPYPSVLQVKGVKPPPRWISKIGLKYTEGISVTLLCERCKKEPDHAKPYVLEKAGLELDEKAMDLYLDTGVAVVSFVLAPHLDPMFCVANHPHLVALLGAAQHVPGTIREAAKDLVPELQAYTYYKVYMAVRGLTGRLTPDEQKKVECLWPEFEKHPLRPTNLGGAAHHHLGRIIEDIDRKELHLRRPYGGLVRVLRPKEPVYEWVCDKCWSDSKGVPELPIIN
jgi:hypothetical protein